MEKAIFQVEGMSCAHCEKAIKNALTDLGVKSVKASSKKRTVEVLFAPETISMNEIETEIKELGYHITF